MAGVDLDGGAHAGAQWRRVGRHLHGSRIGTRCTTLTQLPDAFCAGSTENSVPVAGRDAGDSRLPFTAGIGVDRDAAGAPAFR